MFWNRKPGENEAAYWNRQESISWRALRIALILAVSAWVVALGAWGFVALSFPAQASGDDLAQRFAANPVPDFSRGARGVVKPPETPRLEPGSVEARPIQATDPGKVLGLELPSTPELKPGVVMPGKVPVFNPSDVQRAPEKATDPGKVPALQFQDVVSASRGGVKPQETKPLDLGTVQDAKPGIVAPGKPPAMEYGEVQVRPAQVVPPTQGPKFGLPDLTVNPPAMVPPQKSGELKFQDTGNAKPGQVVPPQVKALAYPDMPAFHPVVVQPPQVQPYTPGEVQVRPTGQMAPQKGPGLEFPKVETRGMGQVAPGQFKPFELQDPGSLKGGLVPPGQFKPMQLQEVQGKQYAAVPPGQAKPMDLGNVQDQATDYKQYQFNGSWMPSADPMLIGAENYKTLQNLRYGVSGLEGVLGYTAISAAGTYTIENGIQLVTPFTVGSYVLAWADQSGITKSVFENRAAPPATGNFVATAIHDDPTGTTLGRFSDAPDGAVAYANGKESCIYSGDESRVNGFVLLDQLETACADLSFTATTTIQSAATNFVTAGFKPGMQFNVTGSYFNNSRFTIKKIESAGAGTYNKITTVEETVVSEAAATTTVTLTGTLESGAYEHFADLTDAVNNNLQTAGNVALVGGGVDSNVLLLIHGDGTDGSTTITDSSSNPKSITVTGNTHIETDQSKFGGASVLFGGYGSADVLQIDDSDGVDDWWYCGSNDFTIDGWIYILEEDYCSIFRQYENANNFVRLNYSAGGNLYFDIQVSGGAFEFSETYIFSQSQAGAWHHFAVERNGSTLLVYWDGFSVISSSIFDPWPDFSAPLSVGFYLDGYIDEFRFSKGVVRWPSDTFTPPNTPYLDGQKQFLALSTRPLQGLKAYVSSANSESSSLSVWGWNGSSMTEIAATDGTAISPSTLAQSGVVDFTASTDSWARPMLFEGTYLYPYLFELSAGTAEIYRVTLDKPFQAIRDLWDNDYRQPSGFHIFDATKNIYEDYTADIGVVSADTGVAVGADLTAMTTSEHVIITTPERASAFYFTMVPGYEQSNIAVPTIQYNTAQGWRSLTLLLDTTNADAHDYITLGKKGHWAWTPPAAGEEIPSTLFGVNGYQYKVTFSATLSGPATIDTVTYIPAQLTVGAFDFPVMYNDRLMLMGYSEDGRGGRVDYSAPGQPDVWNGEQTSWDNRQSLNFGGSEKITASAQLYHRIGSNLYSTLLVLKPSETFQLTGSAPSGDDAYRIFQISDRIGCPAPMTLATAQIERGGGEQPAANIALWLSTSGPVIFDGSAITILPGLEKYFDPGIAATYINFNYATKARGWFDPVKVEYNLCAPIGSSVENNWYVAYDLRKGKWFEKVPEDYPTAGFNVRDSYGNSYVYGAVGAGTKLMRFENGVTWAGTAISQVVETGDFMLTGNAWEQAEIDRVKWFGTTLSEAADCTVTHYTDTMATGTTLSVIDLNGGAGRVTFDRQEVGTRGITHRFKWETATSTESKGMKPLGWGVKWHKVAEGE